MAPLTHEARFQTGGSQPLRLQASVDAMNARATVPLRESEAIFRQLVACIKDYAILVLADDRALRQALKNGELRLHF
jgi:hypothetical protein